MSKRRNLKKEKQERNRAYARKFKKRKLRTDGRPDGGNVTGTYFSGQILYSVIRTSTKLPIIMDADKTILIFVLVLVMCMGSAAVAMRKLVDADPAEIF